MKEIKQSKAKTKHNYRMFFNLFHVLSTELHQDIIQFIA